jgi:hypothetical protein
MAFGNILTLFNSTDEVKVLATEILNSREAQFVIVESTFYIQTAFKDDTAAIGEALRQSGLDYSFVFINIKTGSQIWMPGLDPARDTQISNLTLLRLR